MLEAEEMILLSNHQPTKAIPIRSINFNKVNTPAESSNTEQEMIENLEKSIQVKQKQLEELEDKVKTKLENAEMEITKQKDLWKQEKEQLITSAKKEGYEKGFEVGKNDSLAQYHQLIENANSIIDKANIDYQNIIESSDEEVLHIAIEVANKILHQELKDDTTFHQMVKGFLKQFKEQSTIKLFVHPDDYERLLAFKDELMQIVNHRAELFIYPNEELSKHSCLLETPYGKIDASIDSQLEEIRNRLFQLMEEIEREHSALLE